MEDLDAASLEDVQAFYRDHYAPNNAVVAVVGDVEPDRIRELVGRYFGGAEPSDPPPEKGCEVSFSPGFRADTVRDPNANLPAVVWTFRTPPHDHRDTYALTLLSKILGEGESSRLHRAMVRDALVRGLLRRARSPAGIRRRAAGRTVSRPPASGGTPGSRAGSAPAARR